MTTKLFVGSLSYNVNDQQLNDLFSSVGKVTTANVISDKHTCQSKGFGFVEMTSEDDAKEAIKQLNNRELDGRSINVSEAKPREDRPQRSFGGGFGGHKSNHSKRRY